MIAAKDSKPSASWEFVDVTVRRHANQSFLRRRKSSDCAPSRNSCLPGNDADHNRNSIDHFISTFSLGSVNRCIFGPAW